MSVGIIHLYALLLFAFLSWLIFVLTMCKIYKLYQEFCQFKNRSETELNGLTCNLRKAEETRICLLNELKRTNKLLNDLYKDKIKSVDFEPEIKDEELARLEHKTGPLPVSKPDSELPPPGESPKYREGSVKECFNF